MDSNLDIAKFAHDLRHEEAIHRKTGRISYRGELDFKNVVDASVVHEAAASLKRSG